MGTLVLGAWQSMRTATLTVALKRPAGVAGAAGVGAVRPVREGQGIEEETVEMEISVRELTTKWSSATQRFLVLI